MNAKLVKCRSCGAEVAKNAKRCPNCGARRKTTHPVLGVVLAVLGIFLVVIAFGGESGPKKVDGPDASAPVSSATPAPEKTTFAVGEGASLNDIVVTLTEVSESTGSQFNKPSDGHVFVLCTFVIENNSDRDIAVSSLLSFNAYADDFTTNISLSALLETQNGQLDGEIAAGKKMSGSIGYEVPSDWGEIEVQFTPDFWSGSEIIFVAPHS